MYNLPLLWAQDILDFFHCKTVQKYNLIHLNKLYQIHETNMFHPYSMVLQMANIHIFDLFGDYFYVYIFYSFVHNQLDIPKLPSRGAVGSELG